jgi:hypothetical protein
MNAATAKLAAARNASYAYHKALSEARYEEECKKAAAEKAARQVELDRFWDDVYADLGVAR